jgi:hypothetical protein
VQTVLDGASELTETAAGAPGVTTIVWATEVICEGLAQLALDVIRTATLSPLARAFVVKLTEVWFGTIWLLMSHWYPGADPPFVGSAVKVTVCPLQIVFPDTLEVATTEGTTPGWRVMASGAETTSGKARQAAVEVSCTV